MRVKEVQSCSGYRTVCTSLEHFEECLYDALQSFKPVHIFIEDGDFDDIYNILRNLIPVPEDECGCDYGILACWRFGKSIKIVADDLDFYIEVSDEEGLL